MDSIVDTSHFAYPLWLDVPVPLLETMRKEILPTKAGQLFYRHILHPTEFPLSGVDEQSMAEVMSKYLSVIEEAWNQEFSAPLIISKPTSYYGMMNDVKVSMPVSIFRNKTPLMARALTLLLPLQLSRLEICFHNDETENPQHPVHEGFWRFLSELKQDMDTHGPAINPYGILTGGFRFRSKEILLRCDEVPMSFVRKVVLWEAHMKSELERYHVESLPQCSSHGTMRGVSFRVPTGIVCRARAPIA
ncbi:hypothetical protein K491DRAFT_684313 [Lophiostoma macrostomum CBS 122681]|uniref:Uncharacterized protein n=1 Tax=Lophiostoma macrostomum CBS 122681 TaxID=1314788 RepID=A0A6A6SMF8_9PLEO|nr:hypothetical protein K491DRAFT_684313 [Lophiostoma macrostomum CBS 122681]